MKIREQSFILKKFRNLFWVLFHKLENNANSNFKTNGEEYFLRNFFKLKEKQSVVVFDIGANVGTYSEMLRSTSPKYSVKTEIHVFEPTSFCFSELEAKFMGVKDVILNKLGVSENEGSSEIFFDAPGSTLTSLYQREIHKTINPNPQKATIELIRLDNYINKHNLKHIDLLKLDIEGHDLSGLKSLGTKLDKNFIDFIQFEYGGTTLDARVTLRDFYRLLESSGFVVCKLKPKFLELREYELVMDNFNYANFIAISENVLKQITNN